MKTHIYKSSGSIGQAAEVVKERASETETVALKRRKSKKKKLKHYKLK